MNDINSENFAKGFPYKFKDDKILVLALTHSSYANQMRKEVYESNERLEFLGDAVLDMVVSEYMYDKFPHMLEGELTKLRASVVCETSLARIAKSLNLGEWILLGKGESSTGGRKRDSILADVFEAVIGAIVIDGGIESAKKYILEIMSDEIDIMKSQFRNLDFKTHLQEVIQRTSKVPLVYEIIDEHGPDHDKIFVAIVTHEGKKLGEGQGKSKKESEQSSAQNALKVLENIEI